MKIMKTILIPLRKSFAFSFQLNLFLNRFDLNYLDKHWQRINSYMQTMLVYKTGIHPQMRINIIFKSNVQLTSISPTPVKLNCVLINSLLAQRHIVQIKIK